jgi:hypothetical protein
MIGPTIAARLGMRRSTVGAILRRLGLGRHGALETKSAPIRYERERPGELIHIDTRSLAGSAASATASMATIPAAPARL